MYILTRKVSDIKRYEHYYLTGRALTGADNGGKSSAGLGGRAGSNRKEGTGRKYWARMASPRPFSNISSARRAGSKQSIEVSAPERPSLAACAGDMPLFDMAQRARQEYRSNNAGQITCRHYSNLINGPVSATGGQRASMRCWMDITVHHLERSRHGPGT